MFERRKIKYVYLRLSKKIKNFLLSNKSRELLIFSYFFVNYPILSGILPLHTDGFFL